MFTQEALDRAISEWLVRSDPSPERARREWAAQGVALLPLGERFAAVRMPASVVHTAVQSEDGDQVAVSLGESLGGSIIYDRRVAGGTYYALVQGHAALVWPYGDVAVCLGRGTYLGVPRIDRQQPPGTYWVVPPRYEGDLCAPRAITALVREGQARLARRTETDGALAPARACANGSERTARTTTRAPWVLRLVTDRLPTSPAPYTSVTLDPATQTARYTDAVGRVVEMGKHGTSRTSGTASVSGGGDGQQPQPQAQDDTTTDYESD
ncbi:putative ATP-grasp-modified RiPP [Streptomyces tendae]